ncbi:MAG: rRNA processing protein RimM [Pseudomonadota bacterium]|jgi:16S rRNA processing protein RimM
MTALSESLRKIGKISGVHGLKGELYIYVFSKDISWIDELTEVVFEDAKGQRTTHLVKSLRPFKDGFLVFIEGVNDRTEAEKLRAQLVYVSGSFFVSDEGDDTFYLAEIEGFEVYDDEVRLGIIEGFGTNTVQDLLHVRMDFGIAEIPLVEEFLVEIDFEEKKIFMELPEGLIEIQRESKK